MTVGEFVLLADGLEALEFLLILEQLAREAGFVASDGVEGAGVLDPGARLGSHHFDSVVLIGVGLILSETEIEEVVLRNA